MTEFFTVIGISEIASIITALTAIFIASRRGRDWLIRPAVDACRKNELDIKRLEILLMINTQPAKVDTINNAYDEYKKMGGNSYIDSVIKEWRVLHEQKIIKERLG